jgi:hypothetical protein
MCPVTWQAQYKLKADRVPLYVRDFPDDLKKIEKAFPKILKDQEGPLAVG